MTKLEEVNQLVEELNAREDNKPRKIKVGYEVYDGEHCVFCKSEELNITLPPMAYKTIDGTLKQFKLLKSMSDTRRH